MPADTLSGVSDTKGSLASSATYEFSCYPSLTGPGTLLNHMAMLQLPSMFMGYQPDHEVRSHFRCLTSLLYLMSIKVRTTSNDPGFHITTCQVHLVVQPKK